MGRARVAPLTAEKHGPLRAAAAAGLAAVHARADPTVVLRHLVGVSAAEAAETCRAVAPHAPYIEAEFHAFAASERRGAERREDAFRAVSRERYGMDEDAGYGEDEAEEKEDEAAEVEEVEDRASPSGASLSGASPSGASPSGASDDRAEVMRSTEAEKYYKSREVVAASMERLDATRAAATSAATSAATAATTKESFAPAARASASIRAPSRHEDPASFALAEALAGLAGAGSSARPRALAAVRRALRGGASLAPTTRVKFWRFPSRRWRVLTPPPNFEPTRSSRFEISRSAPPRRSRPTRVSPCRAYSTPWTIPRMRTWR